MLTEGIVAGNAFYIFGIINIVCGIVALLFVVPYYFLSLPQKQVRPREVSLNAEE